MIDVVRKTCIAGEQTNFHFSISSIAYRIKNFTSSPVLVCLGSKWNSAQTIMVGAGSAENIISNSAWDTTSNVTITAETTGIVEVIRND